MNALPAARLRHSRIVDRVAAVLITAGGSLVLLAVAFLMIFLVAQCLPLFRSGRATPQGDAALGVTPAVAIEDEYRTAVVVVASDGTVHRTPAAARGAVERLAGIVPPIRRGVAGEDMRTLAFVDAAGRLSTWAVATSVRWQGDARIVETAVEPRWTRSLDGGQTLLAVAGTAAAPLALVAADDGAIVVAGEDGAAPPVSLRLGAAPLVGALSRDGSEAWLASHRELAWYTVAGDPADRRTLPAVQPLDAVPTTATLALGDSTLLLGDDAGTVSAWQVVAGPVAGTRLLDRTARFAGAGSVRFLAASQRDKTFAVLRPGSALIAHLTSRREVASLPALPAGAAILGISPRRDGAFAISAGGAVARWGLDVPHPEASFSTLFMPVRYEGYTQPELAWQSTGGAATFEPKLSLIPLLVGTTKGALYALIFSAPLAILAALYVSQFAPVRLRQIAKPTVELMAALPSVVVGFLAALLLAPLLQRHVVGVLATLAAIPLVLVVGAVAVRLAPIGVRRKIDGPAEIAIVTALVLGTGFLVFGLETTISQALFRGDIQHWLLQTAGITYDQRNALVVGFGLGFAVIPIIFTLAEDAFSNVPLSLVSASLALGATRWQAARTVVLPASSPGLFAGVMTGFGRAVGETMIVLMATGNTPILSMSPFNGMRTMSACIAVELPEAPYGGTLYRVLILTALLLFAMTFVINTLAVLVAERLRRRFGRLAA